MTYDHSLGYRCSRSALRAETLRLAALACAIGAMACGGTKFEEKPSTVPIVKRADGTIDDRSMCEWKKRPDREASETAGPGSIQPNVRRVYQVVGTGDDRHKIIICREIDTNFDGVKDVVRRYNEKGESVSEEADANYDGRIDTWITFVKGRLAEVRFDSNFDGKPDTFKYYSAGKLSRVVRDGNFDGKPDVWEIYREGKLERMGVDVDGDEHVDRWDHDNELRRRFEEAERKKEEEAALAAQKKAQADREAAEKANEGIDENSPPPAAPKEQSKRPKKKK